MTSSQNERRGPPPQWRADGRPLALLDASQYGGTRGTLLRLHATLWRGQECTRVGTRVTVHTPARYLLNGNETSYNALVVAVGELFDGAEARAAEARAAPPRGTACAVVLAEEQAVNILGSAAYPREVMLGTELALVWEWGVRDAGVELCHVPSGAGAPEAPAVFFSRSFYGVPNTYTAGPLSTAAQVSLFATGPRGAARPLPPLAEGAAQQPSAVVDVSDAVDTAVRPLGAEKMRLLLSVGPAQSGGGRLATRTEDGGDNDGADVGIAPVDYDALAASPVVKRERDADADATPSNKMARQLFARPALDDFRGRLRAHAPVESRRSSAATRANVGGAQGDDDDPISDDDAATTPRRAAAERQAPSAPVRPRRRAARLALSSAAAPARNLGALHRRVSRELGADRDARPAARSAKAPTTRSTARSGRTTRASVQRVEPSYELRSRKRAAPARTAPKRSKRARRSVVYASTESEGDGDNASDYTASEEEEEHQDSASDGGDDSASGGSSDDDDDADDSAPWVDERRAYMRSDRDLANDPNDPLVDFDAEDDDDSAEDGEDDEVGINATSTRSINLAAERYEPTRAELDELSDFLLCVSQSDMFKAVRTTSFGRRLMGDVIEPVMRTVGRASEAKRVSELVEYAMANHKFVISENRFGAGAHKEHCYVCSELRHCADQFDVIEQKNDDDGDDIGSDDDGERMLIEDAPLGGVCGTKLRALAALCRTVHERAAFVRHARRATRSCTACKSKEVGACDECVAAARAALGEHMRALRACSDALREAASTTRAWRGRRYAE